MNLLALALGLFIERFLTHLFHLREARWLDSYFDRGLRLLGNGWLSHVGAALVVLVPVIPVAAFTIVFRETLLGLPYLAFAVIMLLFSLGPRDLEDEVEDYVESLQSGDAARADRIAKELLETEAPREKKKRSLAIEEAIFVQSNNRLFGVVLWFMLLGPAGAWLFRVTDMFRRRAMFEAGRAAEDDGTTPRYLEVAQRVHGVIAWPAARLLALSFALAGSFESAVADWREYYNDCAENFFHVNDDVIACAGLGALGNVVGEAGDPGSLEIRGARSAMSLVSRTLWIWLTAIAILTIFGFAV
ncbi:MAG: regulatory signaling modulator protein AmpE [Gammaproteobacteria bacterium]|nr:regulatory signaling modulator protein AmpE [Gammaproteobacteria bacterium]NNF61034.1 regulatory signaling modulator protein AmpE [Gammaproteobacteria bacterium]NNM21878.1 regulatory signaling modulator protein AmpE [Gammaproteobacteria bacterium]